MQELRNEIAHNKMKIELKPIMAHDVMLLERLNYVLALRRAGLEDERIATALSDLFGSK